MAYFSSKFRKFFKELASNNHKDWFDENRKTYEKEVKDPFKQLVTDLLEELKMIDPEIKMEAKHAIFRINRDIRFNPEMPPYKTHVAAAIAHESKKSQRDPAFYFHFGIGDQFVGGGVYSTDPKGVQKIREYIANNYNELKEVIESEAFKKTYGKIKGKKYKRIPKEFDELTDEIPLLYNKQFYYMKELKEEVVLRDDLKELLIEHFLAGKEFNDYFRKALKK